MPVRAPWPHMSPGDSPLFAQFVLSEQGKKYDAWAFDVHLGPGVTDPAFPDNPTIFNISRYLTQLRVDAIGWIGNDITIFEVKPKARLTAIGQLVTYCREYKETYGADCTRAVITDFANDQTLRNMAQQNIVVYTVLPATPQQINQAVAWTNSLPRRTP